MLKNRLQVLWVLIAFALIVPQMPVFAGEHPGVKASGSRPSIGSLSEGGIALSKATSRPSCEYAIKIPARMSPFISC